MAVLGQRVGPDAQIEIDPAARQQQAERVTILLNNPIGYVSGQAEDGYEPASVLITAENRWAEDPSETRFLNTHHRGLAPAGRLDIDSIGLLVFTQDGRIARALIGEDSAIEKEYHVRVEGTLSPEGMKLLRHGPKGQEKPALLDDQGQVRDLSGVLRDITAHTLTPAGMEKLRSLRVDDLPVVPQERLAVPYAGMGKFIAIGLNYADHAAESGAPVPSEPVIFSKAISCIQGPDDAVMLPKGSKKTDWEVELGVVIGRTARHVAQKDALAHVAGYCVVNDVSEREFQIERGGTWDKGKGCDTFGPIGPWLVTRSDVPNPQRLGLWLDVNGERMQTGHTRTMIFSVARLIAYTSRFITLHPGDVLTTGTPPGVGMGVKKDGQPAPVFLKKGDVMTSGIAGLGEARQEVVAYKA